MISCKQAVLNSKGEFKFGHLAPAAPGLARVFKTQASQAHVTRVECNLLPCKRVCVALQETVETLYEK